MGIATTETTYAGGGDYRWLKSARGTDHPQSGTLDLGQFTPVDGVIKSGTPVTFHSGSGLYRPATATSSADTLAGFVYHDRPATGTRQEFALLTDATVIASLVPGTHDLTDGRYICNAVKPAEGA